jgi:prolycopene isomerase
VTFVPYEYSWSSVFPDFTLNLPFADFYDIKEILAEKFPDETGLSDYMMTWEKLLTEMETLFENGMPESPEKFPTLYPNLASTMGKSIADLLDERQIHDPQLRAILAQSWPYLGLPPSQVPAFLYLYIIGSYYKYGSYYIKGTSQSLSNALSQVIKDAGGEVILKAEVTEILLNNNRAVGVKARGRKYYANAVVSNASVPQTFGKLISTSVVLPPEYLVKISSPASISSFNVWLALDRDITNEITQSNVVFYPSYNHEDAYSGALLCDPEKSALGMAVYDKIIDGFSPKNHSSVFLTMLSDYDPWKRFEKDYFSGNKKEYYKQKKRITENIIALAEENLLPGLSDMIVMQEASTPLTNIRYTRNNCGAMYGYNQTLDNAGFARVTNRTPIEGLYLSSAWSFPGGGYEAVLLGGKETFRCMIQDWFALS